MDTTRPEPEAQQTAEGGHTSNSPPRKAEENISPERQSDEEEQPVSSPENSPTEGQRESTPSLEDQAEAETVSPTLEPAKVSFPRLSSPTSPTDGHFGVVSTGGQLVCEFKGDDVSMSPPPEEKIVDPVWDSEPKTLGGSVLLPPQASNWIEVVRPSNPPKNKTVSTSEFEVDRDNLPEVYIAEEHGTQHPPPRRTLSREGGSLCTVSEDFSTKVGYLENNHMSVKSPVEVQLVTPLHLLGDQSDTVDCPFCMKRVETTVKKKASQLTHFWGTLCLAATFFGSVVPYCCNWHTNIEHHCTNCKRKIAHRRFYKKKFEPLGTRPELKEVSRFEAAEIPEKKRWRS